MDLGYRGVRVKGAVRRRRIASAREAQMSGCAHGCTDYSLGDFRLGRWPTVVGIGIGGGEEEEGG